MKKLLILVLCVFTMSFAFSQEEAKKTVKPVLIIMDIQNAYLPNMDKEESDLMLEYINYYIALFRKYDLPIITVYHQNKQGNPHQDSVAFEFPKSINISPDDPKIVKNYPSAFTKTDLHKTIKEAEGNTLFICGLSAVGCVLATYIASSDYEYEAFLLKNAITSYKSEYTDQIEEIFGAVNYDIVKVLLESTKR